MSDEIDEDIMAEVNAMTDEEKHREVAKIKAEIEAESTLDDVTNGNFFSMRKLLSHKLYLYLLTRGDYSI